MRLFHLESMLVAAQFLALVIVIAAGTALLVALVYGVVRAVLPDKTHRRYLAVVGDAFPFVFMLALVGGLCGQLGGGSREGVVGELLPALFTLFGGFMAYYLGAKRDRSGKVAVNTLAFVLSFFVVYNVSAIWRQDLEAWVSVGSSTRTPISTSRRSVRTARPSGSPTAHRSSRPTPGRLPT